MKRKQQMSMNASMGQQRSRIFYVFSSAMANSATVAVNENQFSTIVDYHMHVQVGSWGFLLCTTSELALQNVFLLQIYDSTSKNSWSTGKCIDRGPTVCPG